MEPILIDIKLDRPGYDRFIGSWVCLGDLNIVIDVGPASSIHRLIESLEAMNMDRVDYILLTHIHIDHAGGLSDFLDHYPRASVISHGRGIRHLIDPSKLWEGSRKTLGEIAELYGPIKPVNPERIIPHTEARIKDLKIIETPGHAPHHLSFCYQGTLFAGEASGNYFIVHGQEYLRPATPPIFFLGECLKSVDRLLTEDDQPLCYAHFGRDKSSHRSLGRSRDQLNRWAAILKEEISSGPRHLQERCVDSLLEKDPELRAFETMEPDRQATERFFMANSIRGYLGFLQK